MNQFFEVEARNVKPVPREVAHFLGYPYGTEPEKNVADLIKDAISEMQEVLRPKLVFEEFDCSVAGKDVSTTLDMTGGIVTPNLFRGLKGSPSEEMLRCRNKFGMTCGQFQHDNCSPTVRIADFKLKSEALSKNLSDCEKVIMFAATVGSDVDKMIRKYQKIDTVKASVMQATGAMFIESFVDAFNEKVKNETEAAGGKAKPRFSPGYGDVPLDVQKLFFKYLDCKKIGLSLMDTLIMAPEKSVTAFIGISV